MRDAIRRSMWLRIACALGTVLWSAVPAVHAQSHEPTSGIAPMSAPVGVAVLTYHHFVTDADATLHPEHLDDMTMSARQFAAQLDVLRAHGAHTLTDGDLLMIITGQRLAPPHAVAIVIDDGYASVFEIAWPLLRARGMKATVAPIVMATESPDAWLREHPGSLAHLTWDQIHAMLEPVMVDGHPTRLVDIASHTYNRHVQNATIEHSLPPAQRAAFHRAVQSDLFLARTIIARRTGEVCQANFLVWPHESASDSLVEVARLAGHQGTFWGAGRLIGPGADPMRIGRFPAGSGRLSIQEFTHQLDVAGWTH